MRRSIFKVFMILLIALTFLAPWGAVNAQTGPYVTANGAVYVFGGPGGGFWILGTLSNGEAVPVLNSSPDGGWWYVSARFGEGWVAKTSVTATSTTGVTAYDPGAIGTVTSGVLNVRYGAGVNAASLGQLGQGDQVYVLSRNAAGSWYEIRWAYGTGWVSAQYLSVSGVPVTVDDGQGGAVPLTTDTPYAVVLSTYLNVRTGPGINFAVLGAVNGGTSLPIVGRSADSMWYQVETVFGTGWVYAGFVAARNEFGGSPVTPADPMAEVTGPIGVINAGALNLRSGPGAQYTSLGTLAGGTETQIVGRTNDWTWWLLDTPIGTGWANAIYVIVRGDTSGVPYVAPGTEAPASPGQAAADAPAPALTGPMAIISTGALNIRSGPNSTFPSLGAVYAGTRMPIVGQSTDRGWWQVESPYGLGWVSKLYILVDGDTSGVPVVS